MANTETEGAPVRIESIEGNATFYLGGAPPDIPPGQGRHCPQCKKQAWALTQHCWSCGFDFDAQRRRLRRAAVTLTFLSILMVLVAAIEARYFPGP